MITSVGTDARTRAALRTTLQDKRFAELREGVWLRPDNLDVELTADVLDRVRVLHARDDDPAELAARLWDLPGWAAHRPRAPRRNGRGRRRSRPIRRRGRRWCATCSPTRCCPTNCCPTTGRATRCATAYTNFAAELVARRDGVELMEAT